MIVIKGSNRIDADIFASRIVQRLKECDIEEEAIVYYMFPIYIGDVSEDSVTARILLLSKTYGILYFETKNSDEDIEATENRMNQVYACLSAKLKQLPELRKGRNLKYEISTILVSDDELQVSEDFYWSDYNNLPNFIKGIRCNIEDCSFSLIQSCIDGTVRTVKKVERKNSTSRKTKAKILADIQSHIAKFDIEQKEAALTELDSPQRIRGLAGSGKTIVLTQKAALYHLKHKDDVILYTYYTKSLHDTIKEHIDRAYKYFSNNREPNWDKIIICHAWGSDSVPGVYSMACDDIGERPMNLVSALNFDSKDPLGYACKDIMEKQIKPVYDMILIDEGQDFTPPFYQLCYRLSKNRKIVWAFDDFQNIFDVTIQDERETFGKTDGRYNVDFSRDVVNGSDIVLSKCYRTPRIPLIAAFSLGLGVYNSQVLQRLSSNELWNSLGFSVVQGNCNTGDNMIIQRPEDNTPSYSNKEFGVGCIAYIKCKNIDQECDWIASQIAKDLSEEDLLPNDICVICVDKKWVVSYFSKIQNRLLNKGIECFNHINTYSSNISFMREGYVTLSTVNKAKGNECACVYVCGVDHIFSNPNNIVLRDTLFTSMTRTKGWLTLTGCRDEFDKCIEEMNKLKDNNFELHFVQPSENATKTIEDQSRRETIAIDKIDRIISELKSLGRSKEDIKKEINRLLEL